MTFIYLSLFHMIPDSRLVDCKYLFPITHDRIYLWMIAPLGSRDKLHKYFLVRIHLTQSVIWCHDDSYNPWKIICRFCKMPWNLKRYIFSAVFDVSCNRNDGTAKMSWYQSSRLSPMYQHDEIIWYFMPNCTGFIFKMLSLFEISDVLAHETDRPSGRQSKKYVKY